MTPPSKGRPLRLPASSGPRRRDYRSLRTVVRAGVVVLIAVLGAIAMPAVAQAHTDLTSSVPSAGETLRVPPALIRLQFNEALAEDFTNLTVAVGSRSPVDLRVEVNTNTVTARVPASFREARPASQRWRLAYRIVSEDGHPVTGTLRFAVAPLSAARPSPSAAGAPASPSPEARTPAGEEQRGVVSVRELPDDGVNAWLPTAVIGAIAASAVAVSLVWLVRGRRRDQRE